MEGYLELIKEQKKENDKLKENYETSVEHLQQELKKQRKITKYYLEEYNSVNKIIEEFEKCLLELRLTDIDGKTIVYRLLDKLNKIKENKND